MMKSRGAPAEAVSMPPLAASATGKGTLTWDAEAESYVFSLDTQQYRVTIGPADEQSGLLRIEGRLGKGEWQPLVRGAGMLLREEQGNVLPPEATHERVELQQLRHQARGRSLSLKYTELLEGRTLRRGVEIRLAGNALEIRVEAPGGLPGEGFCGFSLGEVGPDEAGRVSVPGLPEPLVLVPPRGFLYVYADRFSGQASAYPPGGAFYRADAEEKSAVVAECFYLTLSADPLEPLPELQRPPAPYRETLLPRITLDFFSEQPYNTDRSLLMELRAYGLRDVLLLYRNWQQFGYGRRGPLLYPADPERGGNEAFRRLLADAAGDDWMIALREEYATMTPDCPYWDEKSLARWGDGPPRLTRRAGQFGVAAHRMLEFARLESTKIQRNYRPTAVFVDGHTGWNPEGFFRQVEDEAKSPVRAESGAIRQVEGLFSFLREIHEGPVVGAAGEGAARFDTFAAGMAEGVVRGPDHGAAAPLIVDYELQVVRPKLVGIGAGSYRQFSGYPTDEPVDAGRVDWDAYRATEIALGHAGYVGNYRIKPGPRGVPFPGGSARTAFREYHLLRALQEWYLDGAIHSIAYRHNGRLVDLAAALHAGADLVNAQVRIEYENGLNVWVNRSGKDNWWVDTGEGRYELPPSGFVATAPDGELVVWSANLGGQRADYCRVWDYVYLDVRGSVPQQVGDLQTDGAVAVSQSEVPERHDVVMVCARQLTYGEDEYWLSERADVQFRHLSPREVEITVMDSESGKPVHVQWPLWSWEWKADGLQVEEREADAWVGSRCQVQHSKVGLQLARARPGVAYRISITES